MSRAAKSSNMSAAVVAAASAPADDELGQFANIVSAALREVKRAQSTKARVAEAELAELEEDNAALIARVSELDSALERETERRKAAEKSLELTENMLMNANRQWASLDKQMRGYKADMEGRVERAEAHAREMEKHRLMSMRLLPAYEHAKAALATQAAEMATLKAHSVQNGSHVLKLAEQLEAVTAELAALRTVSAASLKVMPKAKRARSDSTSSTASEEFLRLISPVSDAAGAGAAAGR